MQLLKLTRHKDGTYTAQWSDGHPVAPLTINALHHADGRLDVANMNAKPPALTAEQMETAVPPQAHPVQELVAKGIAARPDLTDRMTKAGELVEANAVTLRGTWAYVGKYTVKENACDCKDFEYRGGWCKHRLAVRMTRALTPKAEQRQATGRAAIQAHQAKFTRWCNTHEGKRRYAIMAHARGASRGRVNHLVEEANALIGG